MIIFRYLLCLLGIVLTFPLLILILLAFKLPITISGLFYLIAGLFVTAGLILASILPRHLLKIFLIGVMGFLLIVGVRMVGTQQNQSSEIQMITLPKGNGLSWISSILDEQDSLIFGEELFHRIGGDSTREHEGLVTAFQAAYSEIKTQGLFPSPIVNTYLNLQQPNAFNAVIIKPKELPKFGVVFLHGYMGNVAAQCWEIAQPAQELGGLTICPSTEWTGQWWKPKGQMILKITFDYLRKQGIEKIYLGGFSNGGFSIGQLTTELTDEKGIVGLFFIDGFMNGKEIKELGLPVLIIEGTQDERVPPAVAHEFVSEVGVLGTYVEIDSDHFLIMKQPKQVQNAISLWLKSQIDR